MTVCAEEYEAPHSTNETWPFEATYRGAVTNAGVEACVLPTGTEPADSDWLPAVLLDSATHVLVAGLTPGWYRVWARITRGDWRIVLKLQTIHLT